jgi:hypothetical protein
MTEKQAAVLITLSAIFQKELAPANPHRSLLDELTREMCDELKQLDVPTSRAFDLLSKHGF